MAGKRFTSVLCLLMLALACGTVFAQSHELKIASHHCSVQSYHSGEGDSAGAETDLYQPGPNADG